MYEEAFELLDKLFENVEKNANLRDDIPVLFEPIEGKKYPWACPKVKLKPKPPK